MAKQFPSHLKPTIPVSPFTVDIPEKDVADFKHLLRLSKLPSATYEGQHRKFGVTSAWMRKAKDQWENEYDWRTSEKKINSMQHFKADCKGMIIHFVALFSPDPEAEAVVIVHGWPGSFLENYQTALEMQKSDRPVNIIIPSLPGFAFSSRPPLDRDYRMEDLVEVMDTLMCGLGFKEYISVGGDFGSRASVGLAGYPRCRGIHLSMMFPHESNSSIPLSEEELAEVNSADGPGWLKSGRGYMIEHATKPSTISHAISSSPLALLAWIGEKYLDWTDQDPEIEFILEVATLWWLTETYPGSIYLYRGLLAPDDKERSRIQKPFGFSKFPHDILAQPRAWVEAAGELIYFQAHKKGGHFPGFERPEEYARDILGYLEALKAKETEK